MLNSFWGKLAQRSNMNQTKIIHTLKDYFELIGDEKVEIKGEMMVNDETLMLNWKFKDDEDSKQNNTNIAVASYVTAYARLELYNLLEKIEQIRTGSVLYFDTDSVIYYRKKSDPEISIGDYLGELKDEILDEYGEGAYIDRFATAGPKNYALDVKKPGEDIKPILKFKGLTLNLKSDEILNFKTVWDVSIAYTQGGKKKCMVPQRQFKISNDHSITTRYIQKVYQATSSKRQIVGNKTLPYGF